MDVEEPASGSWAKAHDYFCRRFEIDAAGDDDAKLML